MTALRRTLFGLFAMVALAAVAARAPKQPHIFNKVNKKAMETWVSSTFRAMTPDERIAQLMVIAVNPRDNLARATVKKLVEDYKVGGLIYNENDIVTQAKLTNLAQSMAKVPLMITLDAEWGLSMRLEDAPVFSRNLLLGSIGDDKVFYDYGREVARQCRRIGVNVDFAPVLDVIDRAHTVIGTRSYGSNPEIVARHGIAFARGLEDGGVLSVAKHFPGHGSTTADSHKELPTVRKSLQELQLYDFAPFQRYVDAGLSGMLTAHLYVPAVDRNRVPSTMSKKYVTGLLKKKMRFQGLIFTDALEMGGAKAVSGSVCVNALLAGNDVLLMPVDVPREIAAIKKAIAGKVLSQKTIDERCKKILRYKYALGLSEKPHIDLANIVSDVNSDAATVLKRRMTASGITVVRNVNGLLPVKNLATKRIAVVTMGNANGTKSMFQRRCANYAQTTPLVYRDEQGAGVLADQLRQGAFNMILICIARENPSYIAAAKYVASHFKNVVVAMMSSPEKLDAFGTLLANTYVKASLVAYDNSPVSEDYLAQTIFGGNAATGILPVDVNGANGHSLKAGTGVCYKACRLGYTIPAEVGFSSALSAKIDSVCRYGVLQHAFPGCEVVVARHGKVVYNRAFGEIDSNSEIAVDENTLFGLASVSKATGTISAVMKAYDEGKFKLDDPVGDYIPGLKGTGKENLTFRELLYHETGMPPSINMWYMMMDPKTYKGSLITAAPTNVNSIKIMDNAYGNKTARLRTDILSPIKTDQFNWPSADGIWGCQATYDTIMSRIYRLPLGEKHYVYSCMNFCLLADAVQNMTGLPMNYYVNNNVFAPLGAYHTLYRPLSKFPESQIAYTEIDTYLRKQHIHGYVHDEVAAFSGGVQGNAGLFSNANDLAKLFQMWLNGGTYGGQRFLKTSTVETFTTQKSPNSHRGLGFDKPVVANPNASNTCAQAPPEVYGHTGFTGTCYWVDPKNDMIYIFLSNRVDPTRNNPNFWRVSARTNIQSIIYQSIIN